MIWILIALLTLSTLMIGFWLYLLFQAKQEDWIAAAYNTVVDHLIRIEELRRKDAKRREKIEKTQGIKRKMLEIFGGSSDKEIAKLQKKSRQIQEGNMKTVSLMTIPGYVFLRQFRQIAPGNIHINLINKNYELYGKKYAEHKTRGLTAKLLSYTLIGLGIVWALAALVLARGGGDKGWTILVFGSLMVLVFNYALYDEVSSQVNKRRQAIEREFPGVVSKLALLVTSGMIMDKAWRETAYSQEGELYREMQVTAEELDNLVSPEAAYSNFIKRCNTNETAKLASALIQNLSKGNAQVGSLLKNMAREAWVERRHLAKQDSEKANAKLMIPTMLLLTTILAMIMVPIAMNFNSF